MLAFLSGGLFTNILLLILALNAIGIMHNQGIMINLKRNQLGKKLDGSEDIW